MSGYTVYMLRNKANGKRYFGMTSRDPKKRWGNGRGYRCNERLHSDILDMGWDSFEKTVLYSGMSKEFAATMEQICISKYESNHPAKGYNVQSGGHEGYTHEQITRRQRQPVRQYSLTGQYIATYPSVSAASEETGIDVGTISYSARGKIKNPKNFRWYYIDRDEY